MAYKMTKAHKRKMEAGKKKYYAEQRRKDAEKAENEENVDNLITVYAHGLVEGVLLMVAKNVGVPVGTLAGRVGELLHHKARR